MDHPDFRVAGKIFATLGYPAKGWGMVKLTPEQQHYLSKDYPGVFVPSKGAWGRRGATSVHLKTVSKTTLRKAVSAAWRNTAPSASRDSFRKRLKQPLQAIQSGFLRAAEIRP